MTVKPMPIELELNEVTYKGTVLESFPSSLGAQKTIIQLYSPKPDTIILYGDLKPGNRYGLDIKHHK